MGIRIEKIKFNPTVGVKKLSIKPRQHYAEDRDYEFMLKIAQESNYWYLWPAVEIAIFAVCVCRKCWISPMQMNCRKAY
ncbi:hypothetical protein [Methylomonas albis]|uniref:Uncharacterized protein n=1 Tax=Methylomonas albis TaxID=1854563 RepID=A0ABR9D542_9GAMM|nr:hypothetical protein [Methylomonas albis]MBD9358045.1 hypothetical protein [Methylomonas albis]